MPPNPVPLALHDTEAYLAALATYCGQIVELDMNASVRARSEVCVDASAIALSPNGESIAFSGMPRGANLEARGLYLAKFHGASVQKSLDLPLASRYDLNTTTREFLDWMADGENLLLSRGGRVLVIDSKTGGFREILNAGAAQASPMGTWITYLTASYDAVLQNLATGESRRLDPGKQVLSPIEWSPDGKYLLLHEGKGSHVPYGCWWVYRLSDSAFFPIPNYAQGGPRPHWIELGPR
ncbi:MAG TPA: hypothetical protein VNX18_07350 [Bryobacteraceae bacterium]|nr:hypothetical protein [Bryobacteraceae bacterium]